MRLAVSVLIASLLAAINPCSASAQIRIPYRQTIESRPYRWEWTGRYVRINGSYALTNSNFGRNTSSIAVQATINPGTNSAPLPGDSPTSGSSGNALGGGAAGGGGAVAGRSALRGPGVSSLGMVRGFRFR